MYYKSSEVLFYSEHDLGQARHLFIVRLAEEK